MTKQPQPRKRWFESADYIQAKAEYEAECKLRVEQIRAGLFTQLRGPSSFWHCPVQAKPDLVSLIRSGLTRGFPFREGDLNAPLQGG